MHRHFGFRWVYLVVIACAALIATGVHAATIPFSGQLGFVETDSGGIYSGTPLGTTFSGHIDDVSGAGQISDGTTSTAFTCCLAAGLIELEDNRILTAEEATLLNGLIGASEFTAGEMVDSINLEGDVGLSGGGRLEAGLTYILASSAFVGTSPANYPFNPADLRATFFFLLEEDAGSNEIYSAGGLVSAVPLPPALGLFTFASLLLGICRRGDQRIS